MWIHVKMVGLKKDYTMETEVESFSPKVGDYFTYRNYDPQKKVDDIVDGKIKEVHWYLSNGNAGKIVCNILIL